MNIIKKLIHKIKGTNYQLSKEATAKLASNNHKSKLAKNIATLVLATTLAITPLSLTACAPKNTTTPNPTPGVTDNPNISQYSQILQTVLTDDYYNNLTNEHIANGWLFSNKIAAIPYSFLKQKGININAIKNNQLECLTEAYIENNNKNTLIVSVKAEVENGSDNYFDCYKLKYTLTDKEYADLYMLHNGRYIQAPYFIQEMSKNKTPTILTNIKINTNTYKDLVEVMNNVPIFPPYLENRAIYLDILEITDANHFSISMRSAPSPSDMLTKNGIARELNLYAYPNARPTLNNGIYKIDNVQAQTLNATNLEEFKSESTNITYFCSQDLQNINMVLKAN